MPIPESEMLLTLGEAAQAVRGRVATYLTVWRWIHRGLRGVKLEYIYIGAFIRTSKEALERFYAEVARVIEAERAKATQPVARPVPKRCRAADDTDATGLSDPDRGKTQRRAPASEQISREQALKCAAEI